MLHFDKLTLQSRAEPERLKEMVSFPNTFPLLVLLPLLITLSIASSPTPSSITVPGYFSNFKEAVEKCTAETTSIIVQPGEHRWENFLEVGQRVDIRGSSNPTLPGTLWMKKGSGGDFSNIEMIKETGSCIIFEGGQWNIESCRLFCSRWAVLWCRCESETTIKNCFIGGVDEGPGYCVNCQDHARTFVQGCTLERCSGEYSAAVAVFHNVRTRVHNCVFQGNQFALRAVTAKDVTLELIGNTISGDLWYDNSRPGNLVRFITIDAVQI
jgi:hypothetical protein